MTQEDAPTSTPVSLIDTCGWYGHRAPTRRPVTAPAQESEAFDFVL